MKAKLLSILIQENSDKSEDENEYYSESTDSNMNLHPYQLLIHNNNKISKGISIRFNRANSRWKS